MIPVRSVRLLLPSVAKSGARGLRCTNNRGFAEVPSLSGLVEHEPQGPRVKDAQQQIARLLANRSHVSKTSYASLPCLHEARDLLLNPRFAPLVVPLDRRLLAPLYRDVNAHNAQLHFFQTGQADDATKSCYVRSFMPHCQDPDNRFYLQQKDGPPTPWQPLASLLVALFASMGVTGDALRDFYTHVLPAHTGRHNAHRDQLQTGTWKVDMRWCSEWTELLVLDEADGCWYALRFPPGGSGFVIDSALFTRFHAVRAGAVVQQSVLAVFNQQGTNAERVRDAVARMAAGAPALAADHSRGPFEAIVLPHASRRHPRAVESARVAAQSAQHVSNCLQWLRTAVAATAESSSGRADDEAGNGAGAAVDVPLPLSRVPRAVVLRALHQPSIPPDVRAELLTIYENRCKRVQHVMSGAAAYTPATRLGHIQAGKKNRRIIDDRLVSIYGSATVGDAQDAQVVHFNAYDGTEATRLRFAWIANTEFYILGVSTESGNPQARNLALLAKKLGFQSTNTSGYRVYLQFDGDHITGSTAALLREHGLTLRVVHVAGELDHTTKRTLELERAQRTRRRLASSRAVAAGRPQPRRSAWTYALQDQNKLAKQALNRLSTGEKKVYDDKAEVDQQRYNAELSLMPKHPKYPSAPFAFFVQDNLKLAKGDSWLRRMFARLSSQEKQVYEGKAEADRLRYQAELADWHSTHPKGHLKLPRSAWIYFLQDYRSSAKRSLEHMSSPFRKVFEEKSAADMHRFDTQLHQWQLTNPKAPVTAFEIFQEESTSPLLQQFPDKYVGREGQHRLSRELRSQWHQLTPSTWSEYERKLQQRL